MVVARFHQAPFVRKGRLTKAVKVLTLEPEVPARGTCARASAFSLFLDQLTPGSGRVRSSPADIYLTTSWWARYKSFPHPEKPFVAASLSITLVFSKHPTSSLDILP